MELGAFRSFASLFNEPLLLVRADGDVVWANRAAAALSGAGEGDLAGRRLHDMVMDDPSKVDAYLARFSRSRQALPGALLWRRPERPAADVHCEGAVAEPAQGGQLAIVAVRIQPRSDVLGQFGVLNRRIDALTREVRERQKAEESLREAQARLHVASLAAQVGTWDRDIGTGRLRWSEELERIFGLAPGTFPGTSEAFYERVHPEDRQRVRDAVARAAEYGEEYEIEFRFTRADGALRWMLGRGRGYRDDDGRPWRIAGVGIDITDRKAQERALHESEEWLRFTQRSAQAGSWEWDLASGRLIWSEEFYRLFGLEPGSLEPSLETWARIVHPADAGVIASQTQRTMESGEDLNIEFRAHHPARGERWYVSLGRTLYGEDGRPLRMAGIVLDVTDRKRAEIAARFLAEAGAELSSSLDYEATLRMVAEMAVPRLADWCAVDILEARDHSSPAVPHRLAVTHVDPAKVELAHELQRRWPAPVEVAYGVPAVLRTGSPEIVPEITEEMLRQAAHDEEHMRILFELGLRSYLCVPLVAHGRILGALTFVAAESGRRYTEDDLRIAMELASRAATAIENARLYAAAQTEIVERRRTEEALQRHAEDLARSNAELQDFAYITSHDLKEPLRGISNYASFLLEDYTDALDEPGREKLRTLVRLSKRMYALLDALMEHARLGRVPLRLSACDLGEVAEDVLAVLGPMLEDEQVEVDVGPLPRVECDRRLAAQLLTNLVRNAVAYNMSVPKRVQIGALSGGVPGCTPVIYVRDNGIGIARQHLASIFRMFKRLHHRDQYGGGIGFGLTIARRIVERHGGRIWAESRQGEGATFYFTLQQGRHEPHDSDSHVAIKHAMPAASAAQGDPGAQSLEASPGARRPLHAG